MKPLVFFLFLTLSMGLTAQEQKAQILSPQIQINTAVLPAPEEHRNEATVYGYDANGNLVLLREGTNNLVCLSDNPNEKGIQVSCYSKKLDAFMKRGRDLKAEGKEVKEIREIRKNEVEAGTLIMPDAPSMLYVLTGEQENFDAETGELKDAKFRYVIYTPFATTESTGLPDKPHAPGMPWLMDPGTHRAHIMITPAN